MAIISTTQLIRLFGYHPGAHFVLPQAGGGIDDCRRSAVALKAEELGKHVLDDVPLHDSFAWNSIIHSHLVGNDPDGALQIYIHMMQRWARPDRRAFPRVLTASRITGKLHFGLQLHGHALKLGFCSDPYVVTSLIEMYGNLQSLEAAHQVFDKAPVRNSVAWTRLAKLYMVENDHEAVIRLFYEMVGLGMKIDSVALATAACACGLLKSIKDGRFVHTLARKYSLQDDLLVCNSLVQMYIDCNNLEAGREIFDRMLVKDSISWTEMIGGYVKRGGFNEALKLFRQMIKGKVNPDAISISGLLPACSRTAAHKNGKEINGYVIKNSMDDILVIQNSLVDMYAKSGSIESAIKVFDRMKVKNVMSWTIMILGFNMHRQGEIGIEYFHRMEKEEMEIDDQAYEAVLHCCATARKVDAGKFYLSRIKNPVMAHYVLMVKLLSRAGLLDQAMILVKEKGVEMQGEVLMELLNGCRIHKQFKLGEFGEQIEEWRKRKVYSWIDFQNKVHVFGTGDVKHPKSRQIYRVLQDLVEKMEAERHLVETDYGFYAVEEERNCIQIGHSEILAFGFGLIMMQEGRTIRITKNSYVCCACHEFVKMASEVLKREIIMKDPNCFHHIKDGRCSCQDFW